ncbi:hypothetical protein A4X09_0g2838 [Tilletia walkeri]|uniref:Uncharacterized protein n=1 Tax=Tilletia walkeri TaxID=117179 RepID=A0A8X7T653_9BASI|nr:hypothetical protein A4X09_0g2838 [Tilletia walkeri]
MMHRNWSVTNLLQVTSSSQALDQQSSASMQSIAESPTPRNRSNTFSNDSDSASLQSSTFPRSRKLNGIVQRSTTGLNALLRSFIPEKSSQISEHGIMPSEHLYSANDLVQDRPRRKSDSADELLGTPSRLRKPRASVQPATYAPHIHAASDGAPPYHYVKQIPMSRSEAELRYRPGGGERPPLPQSQTRPRSHSRESSRKQSTSRLGILTPDCCNAANVSTPKRNPTDLDNESFYGGAEWGQKHVDDFHAGHDEYRPSGESGLGLSLTEELTYRKHANHSLSSTISMPLSRNSNSVRRALPLKETHPATHRSQSSRTEFSRLPPLPPTPHQASPYQFSSLAGNSALSLNKDSQPQSSPFMGWTEAHHEAAEIKGSAGLAGTPDEGRTLLQRRARKPLEIGLFQGGSERQEPANARGSASGRRMTGSISMSSMVTSPKSPGSMRSPPPFPPPSMPLPAVPTNGPSHAATSTLLPPTAAILNKDLIYGRHSPLIGATDHVAMEQEGRSRSLSVDTPSAAPCRGQGHAQARNRSEQGSVCTFTPLSAFTDLNHAPRTQGSLPLGDDAPQVELSFLAKPTPDPSHATESELGSLGRLRKELDDYGRTSLERYSPMPSNASHPQETSNLTRNRQHSSPPPVLGAEASGSALTRSDSSRGRRSSISMLPYKNEPSWSFSNQSSPTQPQRELQQAEKSPPGHTSSSSLRHMAAFIAATTPAIRPSPGQGHVANSNGGSMSSRETSPLIPMLHSSSQAGSSASSASLDGPATPAESISERFSMAEHAPTSRRSISVPRILLLGTPEIPTGYEHLFRGRMDAMGLSAAKGPTAAPLHPESNMLYGTAMGQRDDALRISAASSQGSDVGLTARSPHNLSPIPGSGPGSYDTHSARSSEALHSHHFRPTGNIDRQSQGSNITMPYSEQIFITTPSPRASRVTSYAASLGHGRPPPLMSENTVPDAHLYADHLHRLDSGSGWRPPIPASRKSSTNSRAFSGSSRRDDQVDHTSIYGMAM